MYEHTTPCASITPCSKPYILPTKSFHTKGQGDLGQIFPTLKACLMPGYKQPSPGQSESHCRLT